MSEYVRLADVLSLLREADADVDRLSVSANARDRAMASGQVYLLVRLGREALNLKTYDAPVEKPVEVEINGVSYYPAAFA